jgi:DNA (cytosine-5)-methyltransferase 1
MSKAFEELNELLEQLYKEAESLVNEETEFCEDFELFSNQISKARELAKIKHASRGAALTLLSYKYLNPDQDIRAHKEEYANGFSARTFDTKVTIPFLIEHSLPRNVESHWLTQTLSFAPPLLRELQLKTVPKSCGPLLVQVINDANDAMNPKIIYCMMIGIMMELILVRNKDKVVMTRPKNLPIDTVKSLIHRHFNHKYKNNAPRLPQLAIYSIYKCILGKMLRFEGQKLENIQRMKSADRKAGTVGDIVVSMNKRPIEAVEIKFGKSIAIMDVSEAIEKVRAESVSRYYLLSTHGVLSDDIELINKKKSDFLKQNGCEIIVNGVIDTIGYYLRLLPNTTEFLSEYVDLVEIDEDTGYEHRVSWNDICREI